MSIAFDSRPSRQDIESAARDLVSRRGGEVLSTARRYSVSPEDAEDAYQRALEILLTKAPSTSEEVLLPWLKTVVRHEAYALRKKRERDVPAEHDVLAAFAGDDGVPADERAEHSHRLRVGAEALGRLKPQETRALLLKAEGLSYEEIAAQTGWTYTKVNRCLTEGRRAFLARVEGIETGAECERLAPLLSRVADGEASSADMATLRPHVRGCATCRATLRDYRAAPRAVAALAPLPIAAGGVLGWVGERAASLWSHVRAYLEGAAATKATAVAASSVAIAGGGSAAVKQLDPPAQRPAAITTTQPAPKRSAPAMQAATKTAVPSRAMRSAGSRAAIRRPRTAAPPPKAPQPAPSKPASTPVPTPAPRASATPAPEPAREPPTTGEFGP